MSGEWRVVSGEQRRTAACFAVCVLLVTVLPALAHSAPVTVTLAATAQAPAGDLTLASIATFGGEGDLIPRLAAVTLGPIAPGAERRVGRGYVFLRLRQAGIDPRTLGFEGAEVCVVRASGPAAPPVSAAVAEGAPRPPVPAAPVIERGAKLLVRVDCGLVEVLAEGEALGKAGVGECVRVRLLASGKTVTGRVVDGRTVIVETVEE